MRHGWTGKDERLLDPAVISRDPNTSIHSCAMSRATARSSSTGPPGRGRRNCRSCFRREDQKDPGRRTPSARLFFVELRARRQELLLRAQRQDGNFALPACAGHRPLHDTLIFGREFHGEPLGGHRPVLQRTSPTMAAIWWSQIERGVPARRVDIVFRDLTKPDRPSMFSSGASTRDSPPSTPKAHGM